MNKLLLHQPIWIIISKQTLFFSSSKSYTVDAKFKNVRQVNISIQGKLHFTDSLLVIGVISCLRAPVPPTFNVTEKRVALINILKSKPGVRRFVMHIHMFALCYGFQVIVARIEIHNVYYLYYTLILYNELILIFHLN